MLVKAALKSLPSIRRSLVSFKSFALGNRRFSEGTCSFTEGMSLAKDPLGCRGSRDEDDEERDGVSGKLLMSDDDPLDLSMR